MLNNNCDTSAFVGRYVVGSNRVLFLLKDGAKSWEVKNFLVNQERCELVTIEGKDYPGKGAQKVSSFQNLSPSFSVTVILHNNV